MAQIKKNLPKRCSNERAKARRERCWKAGQARKAARVAAARVREAANKAARSSGLPTAYELKKAALSKLRADLTPQPRTPVGNIIVDKLIQDEHGLVLIKAVKPCCNAKSFYKCDHWRSSEALPPRKFFADL
jgi:hypothetical protein